MFYSLVKPLLFAVDPELAHEVGLELLQQFHGLLADRQIAKPTKVMGLKFANPVGLAAGLDKNADYLDGLGKLGFGSIEVGSVTPRPQPGNPTPRLFRLPRHQSVINRMGFNNKGVDYLLRQVDQPRNFQLGINIGKNKNTPLEQALDDYNMGLISVYSAADYIVINISSPNTPGLRELQNEEALQILLAGIRETRLELEDTHQCYRPLALKLSPDLEPSAIPAIAKTLRKYAIDGLIATNTTLSREKVASHPLAAESGGLSGAALREQARCVLSLFHNELGDEIPIISVGGIDSVEEAKIRFELGAKLIQIYTGLIYQGPSLINAINRSI